MSQAAPAVAAATSTQPTLPPYPRLAGLLGVRGCDALLAALADRLEAAPPDATLTLVVGTDASGCPERAGVAEMSGRGEWAEAIPL